METANAMVMGSNHPGDLNQAMIELGSTVCKVRDPMCASCPIQRHCHAYQVTSEVSRSRNHTCRGADVCRQAPNFASVQDIEDACTLCEPLAVSHVNSYPMKAERKKPREEMDVVNVVEWRDRTHRWFLLVRRPKEGEYGNSTRCGIDPISVTGLLAGLYEFPTLCDVSPATPISELTKIPHALLSNILVPAIQKHALKVTLSDVDPHAVRIQDIKSGGDVLHVFSHIRKTYRLQWVVLEGGAVPPQLVLDPPVPGTKKGKGKTPNACQKEAAASQTVDMQSMHSSSKWVLLDEVAEAK